MRQISVDRVSFLCQYVISTPVVCPTGLVPHHNIVGQTAIRSIVMRRTLTRVFLVLAFVSTVAGLGAAFVMCSQVAYPGLASAVVFWIATAVAMPKTVTCPGCGAVSEKSRVLYYDMELGSAWKCPACGQFHDL